jgi:methyl-accepting chemotaxis protein
MSIGKKLYLNFGAILTIVLILSAINFVALERQQSARIATQAALEVAQAYEKVRMQTMQNRLELRNYLLSGDERDAQKITAGMARLDDFLSQAMSKVLNEQQRDSLLKLRAVEEDWLKNFAMPLMEKRRQVDAGKATIGELQITYLRLGGNNWVKQSNDLLSTAEKITAQELENRRKYDTLASSVTKWILLFGSLGVIVLGLVISYKTAKSITDPLEQLMAVARDIGDSGDLEHNIDIDRKDEIGELARSFSTMVSYLREMASISEAIAGGDLSHEVEPRSKRDTLGNAFARMSEGLGALVRSVRDSASQVAAASGQVADASEESAKIAVQGSSAIDEVTSTMHEMSINVQNMVKSTQMQASSVTETSASIDQMVASIQRVADTSRVLLDISNRSREEVQNGIASMEKATDGLNRINTSIHASAEIIDMLGNRADDIGKIIEVIDDLAEQTNLLALNAAIEAARAGEHGLGFAVVADEVRKLAEKSAQSTKEISELIQSIQKETRRAVENMEESTTFVNDGLALGNELGAALKKISNVVTEVYKFAQEIGAATNEQSNGSSQIARATTRLNEITHEINSSVEEQASGTQAVVKAMERMRELTAQSTSGSTELAASAEQLQKMSRQLLDAMDRFKLDVMALEAPREYPGTPARASVREAAEAPRMRQAAAAAYD